VPPTIAVTSDVFVASAAAAAAAAVAVAKRKQAVPLAAPPATLLPPWYQRLQGCRPPAAVTGFILPPTFLQSQWGNLACATYNDGCRGLVLLSSLVVVLPCLLHLLSLLRGHFADFGINATTGCPVLDHTKIVNNLRKLAASALVFLLFPAPHWWGVDALLGPLGVDGAGAVRMHATAGCLALIGATLHSMCYAIMWVCNLGDRLATWTSVFPLSGSCNCWRGLLPGGCGGGGQDPA
jgi:hypothetical protein